MSVTSRLLDLLGLALKGGKLGRQFAFPLPQRGVEYIVRLALRERTDEFFHDFGNCGDGNTHFTADVDDCHTLDVAVGIDAHLTDAP